MPFYKGHHYSPKIRSKEWGRKISEGLKRRISIVGYKHTCEICGKRIRNNNLNAVRCQKHRIYNFTKEHRENLSKAIKGSKNPKGSEAKKGSKNPMFGKHSWNKGIKITDEIIKNGYGNWQGGKSFEPYSTDWTETLKRAIRERDNYICQLCSQYGNAVHHIDYDKKNCNPENLITLCNNCNLKVNHNRNYWTNYFLKLRGNENLRNL